MKEIWNNKALVKAFYKKKIKESFKLKKYKMMMIISQIYLQKKRIK